jgi:hypothetical protein
MQVPDFLGIVIVPANPTTESVIARRDAALASGSHFLTTDWNTRTCGSNDYFVQLP